MTHLLRLTLLGTFAFFGVSCASRLQTVASTSVGPERICHVRTTAYTHTEEGGPHNAIGTPLSGKEIKSAAADWSRWPLGTKFRIVDTDEIFQIDDYGRALVGTGTIDLYKSNRLAMRKWGVRSVDIDVIEWGSPAKSLKLLAPRKHSRTVHPMVLALRKSQENSTHSF